MTRTSSLTLPSITLDRETNIPIYLQLYRRFRDAIVSGSLRPGDRIASVRSLASELHLARGTVEMAYQMLTSEGYFLARGPAGTFVSHQLNGLSQSTSSAPVSNARQSHPSPLTAQGILPFQTGIPALDAFPRKTWSRLMGRRMRSLDTAALHYPEPEGYGPLRETVAAYLGISRGIACSYEQVFITAGYHGTLALICQALFQNGDTGWYEDPGYPLARDFLQRAGMQLIPVPVDDNGLNVSHGKQLAPQARFALVTPTHQFPLGVALSLARRLELLAWANQQQSWIIEDDYDSEFRYRGHPLPALKSLDQRGRVLYCGTFSKVLFPGLRLGYLVVPPKYIRRFADVAKTLPGPGFILPQATVADFMEQGHFIRHLRKMRLLYATRRGYLVDALGQTFGNRFTLPSLAGGTHLLALPQEARTDRTLAEAAQSQGLAIKAISRWCIQEAKQNGLLLGFTNINGPENALMLTQQLQRALDME